MEFITTVQSRKLVWFPAMRDRKDRFVSRIRDGGAIKITMTRIGKPGSYQQLKTIFGLAIAHILREFDECGMDLATFLKSDKIPCGIPVSKDVMKEYLYAVAGYVTEEGDSKTLS